MARSSGAAGVRYSLLPAAARRMEGARFALSPGALARAAAGSGWDHHDQFRFPLTPAR